MLKKSVMCVLDYFSFMLLKIKEISVNAALSIYLYLPK